MGWIKQGVLIKTEDLQADWIASHVQVPTPLRLDNDLLRLYFSARNHNCYSYPVYADIDLKTYQVRKICTKPLLELGRTGAFDEHGITFSSCIQIDEKIYMYYIGWNKGYQIPYKNAIGLAISEDGGNHFYKYSEEPILDRNLENPFFVATPYIYEDKDKLNMLFLSCTKWEWNQLDGYVPAYLIKKVSSEDGIHWREEGVTIDYKNDHEAIARPWLIYKNDTYYMWYSYRDTKDFRKNRKNGYTIGFAMSKDGRIWKRVDEYAGIAKSEHGWDSEMMCYPSVMEYGDEMVMFYNGNEHGKYALGYATCKIDNFYTNWKSFFHV